MMMMDTIISRVYGLVISKSTGDYNLKVFEQDDFQSESRMIDFETDTPSNW